MEVHPRIWSRATLQIPDNLNYSQQVAAMACSEYCAELAQNNTLLP